MGRTAHSSDTGKPIVSSSNIPINGTTYDSKGNEVPRETPTPLTIFQIKGITFFFIIINLLELFYCTLYTNNIFRRNRTNI